MKQYVGFYDFIRTSRKKHRRFVLPNWGTTLLLKMQGNPKFLTECCEKDFFLRRATEDFVKFRMKYRLKALIE
jgi:hypothetical protein